VSVRLDASHKKGVRSTEVGHQWVQGILGKKTIRC
jgi:hypothetical protein